MLDGFFAIAQFALRALQWSFVLGDRLVGVHDKIDKEGKVITNEHLEKKYNVKRVE